MTPSIDPAMPQTHRRSRVRPSRRPSRRAAVLAPLLLVGTVTMAGPGTPPAAGGAASAARSGSIGAASGTPGTLLIDVPRTAPAGEPLTVGVTGASAGATVTLIVLTSAGPVTFSAVAGPVASFVLPSSVTRSAGVTTLVADGATDAGGATARGQVLLVPGTAVGPLEPVVGARSIVANGRDYAMAVAIPVDQWGNAIADGSEVSISRRTPQSAVSNAITTMSHLVSWLDLVAGTVAGQGTVWAQSQGVTGPEVTLEEVAGPPAPFTLELVDPALTTRLGADGRALVDLRTSLLRDPFGNVEPDGTLVTVDWQSPEGPTRSSAETISGVATFTVQSPSAPMTLTLTAACRGTATASPLSLDFGTVVSSFPIATTRTDHGLLVTVGPVIRNGGSFVPDGSIADVTVVGSTGGVSTGAAPLADGTAEVLVPDSGLSGDLSVSAIVLGLVQRYDAP